MDAGVQVVMGELEAIIRTSASDFAQNMVEVETEDFPQVVLVALRARVVHVLAGHLHVAAQRDGRDLAERVAAGPAEELRAEAKELEESISGLKGLLADPVCSHWLY